MDRTQDHATANHETDLEDALKRLAAAGAATHVVRIAGAPEEEDALGGFGAEPGAMAMAMLCAICPGQVARLRTDCYAIDASDMAADTLARMPAALSRRLFGAGYADGVSVEPLAPAHANTVTYYDAESEANTIDWAACEVRIEDVAADLARRVETVGDAEQKARDAIREQALAAIDALKNQSANAIDAVSRAAEVDETDAARAIEVKIDRKIETRVEAVIDRLAAGGPTAGVEAKLERLSNILETAPKAVAEDGVDTGLLERDALRQALEVMRAVMADLRSRSAEVRRISERLADLKSSVAATRAGAAGSHRVAPFGAFELTLGDAPLLPGEVNFHEIVAEAREAAAR